MTGKWPAPAEELLHAYVDGVLPVEHLGAVEGFLAENPAEARRVQGYREQNAALQALGAALAAQPAPLVRRRRRSRWGHPALRVAAAVLLAVLGGAAGWWLHGVLEPEPYVGAAFVQQAALAYRTYVPEVLHPVEVGAAQEKHLVTWLSKRLGEPVRAPHLRDLGFELVGGRLLPGGKGPAAQFMYQDRQMNRLTLYILSAPGPGRETAFRYMRKGSVSVFYWLDDGMDYALAGEVDRERLLAVATAVYKQLRNL